ncbi:hypothetical protein ACS0TY_023861 [Phlomoides rotata]
MKIISINIRGLGNNIKKKEIQEIIRKQSIEFCCIQESKLELVDDRICRSIWGNSGAGWAWKGASGRSGGCSTTKLTVVSPMICSCNRLI